VVARAPAGCGRWSATQGRRRWSSWRGRWPRLSSDVEEVRELPRFHDPDVALAVVSRWRARSDDALIVVDQFESSSLERLRGAGPVCGAAARLVDAAGIHAVLVLRDDFLFECHRFPVLEPILKDLTLVGPPVGSALRRALTEPAARRLHRFEGELLVDEMVAEVERGAGRTAAAGIRCLALWELRDRERRLLTREAYERIGGVGGALAQHAEADAGGDRPERLPIVRELFATW